MRAALPDPAVRYQGPLYRALNPVWAAKPLSGEGANLHGGRFNAKGTPALYTALSVMGAVAEANQIGRPFEPVTLVSYRADIYPVFDATNQAALNQRNVPAKWLSADDWRLQMRRDGLSDGQRLASALIGSGYAGVLVPSFAKGVAAGACNLVLWHWGNAAPHQLVLIDSENRLRTAQKT